MTSLKKKKIIFICVSNFVPPSYEKVITHIDFFFVLFWILRFLQFGPLPSKNLRCMPVQPSIKEMLKIGGYLKCKVKLAGTAMMLLFLFFGQDLILYDNLVKNERSKGFPKYLLKK